MSVHIAAKSGEIAEIVLLPGDPMRAKRLAEKYLDNVHCYSELRGALGFTGDYQGLRLSIQTSGMGMPSMSIYAHELFAEYGVKTAIRIGTSGTIQQHINLRDIILAQSASIDSNINKLRFAGKDYAASANFDLLKVADQLAQKLGIKTHVGNILTTDTFYDDSHDAWKKFAEYGTLAVEMETAALYTLAAKFGVKALAILTVSDHIIKQERASSEDRQNSFDQMVELALVTAVA